MRKYYKPLIVAAIIFLTFCFILLDRTSITPADAPQTADFPKTIVPDVTFTLLDGSTLKLHSLTGHTVLLHFWASWCAPCREEFSQLLKRLAKEDNTVLLAISGDANAADAKRFLVPYKRDFKSLFDSGKVIIAYDPHHTLIEGVFQTFKYPETIVIAPDMSMQQKIVGMYK